MKLTIHRVARFVNGPLSMGTVEHLDQPEKHWIVYAGRGKFSIRVEGDQADRFREELFDSPEEALERIDREYNPGR